MPWLILGGLATALAFPVGPLPTQPPLAIWPFAWIGLAPLLAALLRAESYGQALRAAFVFGCAWMFVDCVWVFRVFDVLGWVLIWVPIGWIVVFGLLAFRVRRAGINVWLAWPVLWMGIEFVRSEWTPLRFDLLNSHWDPLRFSWLVLGHSRVRFPILAQTADLGGGYMLSLTPFLCNLAVACWWNTRWIPWRAIAIICVLVAAEIGYGAWRMSREPSQPIVAVGVVQTEREQLSVLIEMTEALLRETPQTRIVVWPEESFSERLGDLEALRDLCRRRNIWLAAGAEYPTEGHHENRAYWITPSGEVGIYRKRERVPFVELHKPVDDAPTFSLDLEGRQLHVGIAICYDMDFPTTARELARNGAELILVPTLDEGSWGATQHWQHSYLPRLRAIENRRPVVQAATSGVSQIIDDSGRVIGGVPFRLHRRPQRPTLYLEGSAAGAVHPASEISVYTRGGYWFGPATAIAAGIVLVGSLFRRPRA